MKYIKIAIYPIKESLDRLGNKKKEIDKSFCNYIYAYKGYWRSEDVGLYGRDIIKDSIKLYIKRTNCLLSDDYPILEFENKFYKWELLESYDRWLIVQLKEYGL